jgi:hypothetical protein
LEGEGNTVRGVEKWSKRGKALDKEQFIKEA